MWFTDVHETAGWPGDGEAGQGRHSSNKGRWKKNGGLAVWTRGHCPDAGRSRPILYGSARLMGRAHRRRDPCPLFTAAITELPPQGHCGALAQPSPRCWCSHLAGQCCIARHGCWCWALVWLHRQHLVVGSALAAALTARACAWYPPWWCGRLLRAISHLLLGWVW